MNGPASWHRTAAGLILAPLVLLLALLMVHSTTWRMEHDLPLAHYSAFMHAEYGTTPYRQLFEVSFPGTLLVHLGITRVFGYGDRGLMLANLLWFLLVAVVTVKLMAPLGRLVAWSSVVIFGVAYFDYGNAMTLQRDCLLVLPVAAALLVHTSERLAPTSRRIVVGILLGCACAIKPHAAIALVPFLVEEACRLRNERSGTASPTRRWLATMGLYALSFALPLVAVFGWLIVAGGFSAWLEMSREYLPLYLRMNRNHVTLSGIARLRDILSKFRQFGGITPWFLAAGVGAFSALSSAAGSSRGARLVRLLLAEAALFAVYPAFAGQFWDYHYMPFVFFVTLLSSLCLLPVSRLGDGAASWLPKLALVVTLLQMVRLPHAVDPLFTHDTRPGPKGGQVDEIAQFLEANLAPGDTVQPLDWAGGAVHGMLIARARLATSFMYDYHFYHHVSHPFIQELRRRFIGEFNAAQPRFVIDFQGDDQPRPAGDDTTLEFPELSAILAADYKVVKTGREYKILERESQRFPR